MDLKGEKRAELRKALISAFPSWGALQIVVDDRLSEQLTHISSPQKTLPEVAHDLIVWAISRGRLTELVIGAAAENPTNPELRAFAEQFEFVAATGGELERIVLPSVPFENIGQWLERLGRLRRAVCRFESDGTFGSAFLVAPDLLMTNHHVVEGLLAGSEDPNKAIVRFDYEVGADGSPAAGRTCRLAAAWDCGSSQALDYALVRLAEPVGEDDAGGAKRGFVKLGVTHKFTKGEPLMILQHPDAQPLKLSIGSVDQPDVGGTRVAYTANTLPGSSGSPCFNSGLAPVALHHWGNANHNRGVRLDVVLSDLKSRGLDPLLG
jgi:hypothetical protein